VSIVKNNVYIINFLRDTCFLYSYIYVVLFCIIIHACCDWLRSLVGNKQPITYNVFALAHGYLVFVNTIFTHFIFQSQFVSLDHPMLYCTHLTCPISHNAPHSPQMVYINHKTKWTIPLFAKENIDYNYNKMNNILISESLRSLLLWCMTWFKYVNIAKSYPSITWSVFKLYLIYQMQYFCLFT